MSRPKAIAAGLFALLAFAAPVAGQERPADLAVHFQQICGTTSEAGPALPGNDMAAAQAPAFFASDLRRAEQSRVVAIGDRFAMRALMPSSADPRHAAVLKCAVASGATSFSEQVERLSAMLSQTPVLGKTDQGFDTARFTAGTSAFFIFGEADGWVSIYRMDILMRNIDRRYLKRGARRAPPPSVR
ncbi:MAG TPA: hypothetical protein VEZ20_00580 [Allosphingosinicella sp.]|jgi:hypothetical protein|nr:hypothetical protein [Allosphingosinicella sp.]